MEPTSCAPPLSARAIRDGVILLHHVVDPHKQEQICATMLSGKPHDWSKFQGPEYRNNPFMAFCHLAQMRCKTDTMLGGAIPAIVGSISSDIHAALYGPHGVLSTLP